MDNQTVSLQISKDIVNPIVETKIKEAILAAMGGQEKILDAIVSQVLNKRVDENGKATGYSSDKYTWIDVVVTQQIKSAVEAEVKNAVSESAGLIKEAVIKQLKTQKGATKVAEALMDCLTKTFANNWTSKFDVQFEKKSY